MGGDLRVARAYFAGIQKHDRPGRSAELNRIQENETVKSLTRDAADVVLGGGSRDDHVRHASLQQFFC